MTSTIPEPQDETIRGQTLNPTEWLQANTRALTLGAAVVLVAGAGYWFYIRSAEMKEANAEKALTTARQSIQSGNAALASSDLQKIQTRFSGTTSANEAAILLAQVDYDQGKYAEGVDVLKKAVGGAGRLTSDMHSLIGDGLANQGKVDDAVAEYTKAAEASDLPSQKALMLAKEARILGAAGKSADAAKIWQQLLDDPHAELMAAEARIRLGEMQVKPAGK